MKLVNKLAYIGFCLMNTFIVRGECYRDAMEVANEVVDFANEEIHDYKGGCYITFNRLYSDRAWEEFIGYYGRHGDLSKVCFEGESDYLREVGVICPKDEIMGKFILDEITIPRPWLLHEVEVLFKKGEENKSLFERLGEEEQDKLVRMVLSDLKGISMDDYYFESIRLIQLHDWYNAWEYIEFMKNERGKEYAERMYSTLSYFWGILRVKGDDWLLEKYGMEALPEYIKFRGDREYEKSVALSVAIGAAAGAIMMQYWR